MQKIWYDRILEAVRHFVQLLRESMLVRIFTVIVCIGIALLGIIGLGREPQAITVFSEEKNQSTLQPEQRQVKGSKKQSDSVLRDPFNPLHPSAKENKAGGTSIKPKATRKNGKGIVQVHNVSSPTGENQEKAYTGRSSKAKVKKSSEDKIELRGILSNDNNRTAVVSVNGQQYLMQEGDTVSDIVLLELTDKTAVLQTRTGKRNVSLGE